MTDVDTGHHDRAESLEITPELLTRYDRPGPRYTSYPTAPEWREDFGDADYRKALAEAARHPDEPLSVYVHIPFCRERCSFCGCNVIISKKEGVASRYLGYLDREIGMAAEVLGPRKRVMQLHWGGGTPTYLNLSEIERLFHSITSRFDLDPGAEIAIEVDPRVTSFDQLKVLRSFGFNRLSMGVQDLDDEVQAEVNRFQSEEQTRQLTNWARELGFGGINMDLIYGLPAQKVENWAKTIEKIIDMRPDRLAVYSFAHIPAKLRIQVHIDESKLPSPADKLELFSTARRMFIDAGYRTIGMDHFSLPTEELAHALDERRLHRNFMGYTVVPASDMIGFGTSAIGEIGGAYAQSVKKLSTYYEAIDAGQLPAHAGCFLSEDDKIRRWTIRQLMCNFYLDFAELKRRFGIEYDEYFAVEEGELREFYEQGFLVHEVGALRVLPLGQMFIRNVAMVFDAYLKRANAQRTFSRTV
ncbi:MAG: oxygen-independent coproporphyrinogen III oxidase [FCB group bacterium]|jgi:oxygen-independent coproporphyrinogen-3 oxidase|nr:oxygen-independent coproporphyrinogen III oxidase [FCB group bacterium]